MLFSDKYGSIKIEAIEFLGTYTAKFECYQNKGETIPFRTKVEAIKKAIEFIKHTHLYPGWNEHEIVVKSKAWINEFENQNR